MDRTMQDESVIISEMTGLKNLKKYCQKHSNELINIINIMPGVGPNNRLQCIECQYEQSNNVKINFLPLRKLENTQIDEASISQLFNWPIVNEEAQEKLHLYEQLQKKAQKKLGEVIGVVDTMIKEITQVLEEYKKSSVSFYNETIQEAQNVIIELSDIDSLQDIKNILINEQAQDIEQINEKLEDIIENKYKNISTFSNQIIETYNLYSLKLKKFDDFSNELHLRHNKILQFVQSFTKSKKLILKPEIELIKSSGRESSKMGLSTNSENQIVIQKLTDYYGWCYSNSILDNAATYEMEFSFEHDPQNYIMIGLIPEEHKDTEPPGQGKSHFCKIFGDSNNYYCGYIKQGDLIEKQCKSHNVVKMRVCIQDELLEFSDEYGNINTMHSMYTLNTFSQYRVCIQFGQRSKNTIKILKFAIIAEAESNNKTITIPQNQTN